MASAARGFADRAPAVGTEVVWLAVTMQAAQTRFPELLPPHRQPLHVPLVAAPAGGAQLSRHLLREGIHARCSADAAQIICRGSVHAAHITHARLLP